MIFYIHGFASGKNSSTVKKLQSAVNQPVIGLEYDSSASYSSNIASLKKQFNNYVKKYPDEEYFIVGTSLGGFYSIQLASLVKIANCTVFNPVVYPLEQLKQFVDKHHTNFATGKEFDFTESTLKSYSKASDKLSDFPLTIYVSKSDELLVNNADYVKTKYSKRAKIVYTNTKHRIDDFTPYVDDILEDVYTNCIW